VGYRFEATIKSSVVADDVPPPSVPASIVSAVANSAAIPAADVGTTDFLAKDVSSSTRARTTRTLGLFAAVLAIAATIAYFIQQRSVPVTTNAPPVLALLPLHPVGNTPGDTVLAEGLSEELITRLAHMEGLHLISRTSAERAQEDKFDLNQLSERLHVAHARGLLARTLVQDLRETSVTEADRTEAASEAAHALQLDPDQIDAHVALASLAWRASDWPRCMEEYRRILNLNLNLDPTDSILRAIYAARLANLGYGEQALHQVEIGLISDPLNFESNYLRGFLLDMLGRHDEAKHWLDATAALSADITPLLLSARMFNAVWRHDWVAAREFALSMPASNPYRDANIAVINALIDPARWPQAQAMIESSERTTGRDNFARLLQPNADSATQIGLLERILARRSPPFGLLLWIPELAAVRQHAAFQDFLRRNQIIEYWRSYGWPPQCKPDGDVARCT